MRAFARSKYKSRFYDSFFCPSREKKNNLCHQCKSIFEHLRKFRREHVSHSAIQSFGRHKFKWTIKFAILWTHKYTIYSQLTQKSSSLQILCVFLCLFFSFHLLWLLWALEFDSVSVCVYACVCVCAIRLRAYTDGCDWIYIIHYTLYFIHSSCIIIIFAMLS